MLVNIKIIWQKKLKKPTLFGTWHITTTTEKLAEIRKLGSDAKKVLEYLAKNKLVNEDKKVKAPTVNIDLSESYAQIQTENKND